MGDRRGGSAEVSLSGEGRGSTVELRWGSTRAGEQWERHLVDRSNVSARKLKSAICRDQRRVDGAKESGRLTRPS